MSQARPVRPPGADHAGLLLVACRPIYRSGAPRPHPRINALPANSHILPIRVRRCTETQTRIGSITLESIRRCRPEKRAPKSVRTTSKTLGKSAAEPLPNHARRCDRGPKRIAETPHRQAVLTTRRDRTLAAQVSKNLHEHEIHTGSTGVATALSR